MTSLRVALYAVALTSCIAPVVSAQQPDPFPPIIFVHGNGDDAAKWVPVIWLFESNGYPADRLFAIRFLDPVGRSDDTKPEPFRSSTIDETSDLSAYVTRILLETRTSKVVLAGSSRGGMTIRNYIKNAGGAAVVSHAILAGAPNHGVLASDTMPNMEFNGKGKYLSGLNAGAEVQPGVRFLTLRSDKLDKYAQPGGGGYEGPALQGAENVMLPGLDHRELAFQPKAFAEMFKFVTGHAPAQLDVKPEMQPSISGLITSFGNGSPTNRPLAGVHFRVFALRPDSAERDGAPLLDITTTETGAWEPLKIDPTARYEFLLEKEGRSVSYFRAPIPRSTTLMNLRFEPARKGAVDGSLSVLAARPQGYLMQGRDPLTVDGVAVQGLDEKVPTRDSAMLKISADKKSGVKVQLRGETIEARPTADPASDLSIAEFVWE
jgi:triacylglycerol lipase